MHSIIVAEIGINHNGSLSKAKALIDIAKAAGCDAVKFQKRNPDVCVPEHQKGVVKSTPWGEMTYLEYKHKIEFGKTEYDEIDKHCKQNNINWFASPWDLDSIEFLNNYNLKYIKIPSAMLTNIPLLEGVASKNKYTFISTGMSTIEEVDKAVEIFKSHNCPFELMHCVSTYPLDYKEANLKVINQLRNRYKCKVGYSGHEKGLQISLAAVALEATSIERHITLDRTMWGTDQSASLEPGGLNKLVRDIRIIEEAMGDGIKRITPAEFLIRKKLSNF
jgi:N-acetylneuraminate synthase